MSGHGHEHGADIVSPGESSYTNSRVVQEEKETKSSVERWSSGQESEVSVEGGRRVLHPRNLQPVQDTTAFQPPQTVFQQGIFEATSKLKDQRIFFGPLPPASETHLLKESFGYGVAEAVRSSNPASASEKANYNDGAAVTEAMMVMGAGRDAGLVPQTGPEAFSRLRTVAVNNNNRASGCSRTVCTGLTPGDFEKEGLTAPQVAMQCSTVRTDSHESDEESGESSPPEPWGSFPGSSSKRKAPVLHHNHAREPRYAIQTRTDLQNIDDGYKWRKYGQKGFINGLHPRIYYKCNTHNCPVRKRVERSTEDPSLLITTYEGTHAHAHPSFNLKSFKHSPRPGGPGSTPRDRDKEGLTAPQLHMAHESGEKATTSGDDNDVDVAMTLHPMERSTEDPCLLLSKLVNFSSLADPAPSFYQHLQAGDTGWTPSDLDTIRLIHDPLESCYVDSKFQAWNVVDQMEPVVQHDFNLDYRRRHRGDGGGKLKSLLFHGGSVWDAWFSAASNQVAQVLLTLPYSFAQLGFASGIVFQIFYGVIGCWSCYMITCLYCEYRTRKEREGVIFKNHVIQWFEVLDGLLGRQWKVLGLVFNCTFLLFGAVIQLIACASNIFLINDNIDKREWTYIFGACCMLTVLVPSFRNYRLWSFFGLIMISYTAWYMTVAALAHGQVPNVVHSAPTTKVLYFTGATNILYAFGGHAVTVEIMHAMDKPVKFKYVYVFATLYLFTLTIPSAVAVYWAFGDSLLKHSNALSLLPRTHARDVAVVLMLIHQFIMVGFAVTPLYFMWEKLIGIHKSKSLLLRAVARMPVILPVWFLAIAFPFFGPINSAVGALLVTFTVYIIPCVAHMVVYRGATARQNAVEKPPFFMPSWTGVYLVNMFIVIWIAVVGVGWGGWASITNFVRQVDTFGVFAPCYQCPPKSKY